MASRLLLVGAGHAHLHLLTNARRLRDAGYRVVLVSPRWFDYSGSAVAVAVGTLARADARIDVAALAGAHGVEHHLTRAVEVSPERRTLTLEDGDVEWDVVSFNIGSVAADPPGVAVSKEALRVKPLAGLGSLNERLAAGRRVTIIGAGASGLELAANLAVSPRSHQVSLIEGQPEIGGFLPGGAAARVRDLLSQRDVDWRVGLQVTEICDDGVQLADRSAIEHDAVILATGLVPPDLARRGVLGGPNGFPVRATLQHRDHDDVYATGDCADFLPAPLPRLGVYGVRQGPVLLESLLARSAGRDLPVFRPQEQALSILDLGGTALAVRGRWWWWGRTGLHAKRWIDRRWLSRYALPDYRSSGESGSGAVGPTLPPAR